MRCSCYVCGTYMVHSESMNLGCVCPSCFARCKACLGTDSVIDRASFRALKEDGSLLAHVRRREEEADRFESELEDRWNDNEIT